MTVKEYTDELRRYGPIADDLSDKSDTLILNGSYCGMKVCNNALQVTPGNLLGEDRGTVTYYRGMVPFDKIIILSRSGNISIDALYWCRDQDISLLMLDGHGDLVHSIIPENRSAAPLRRLQYLASGSVKIAQEIVHRKTVSQYDTVMKHSELRNRDNLLRLLDHAEWELMHKSFASVDHVRSYEGGLASSYFDAFVGIPIKWAGKHQKIPPHWKRITERISPIGNGKARHATNPFHAALNYLYAVSEHRLMISIHKSGLDPACAFLHADKPNRDSLIYDLIEPHRAEVDDVALSFFHDATMRSGDVLLFPSGQISFNPEFTRYMLTACPCDFGFDKTVSWLKECLTSVQ